MNLSLSNALAAIVAMASACVPITALGQEAHSANPQGPPAKVATLFGPNFRGMERKPGPSDMARAAPAAAMARGVSGRIILFCTVNGDGGLAGCEIESEDPPGLGFGQAALSLVPRFRAYPTLRDGTSVAGGTICIPIRFIPPAA
jgi:protein TonB